VILLSLAQALSATQELFVNTPASSNFNEHNCRTSALNNAGQGYESYDDFQIAFPAQVTAVSWEGYDFYWPGHQPGPAQTVS
jgi:hypothetical protein